MGCAAQKVHWEPTPKQTEALVRQEFEVLYGGARGGGKTDAGQNWLLYDKDNPKYKALVIRKNADDLSDWIERAKEMYKPTGAVFTGKPPIIRFPSGCYIKTGHLKDENAFEKYQGHEYHKMLLEELTQIPSEERYEKLISSCRSTVPGIDPQIFSTTNPGGPGHNWVKRRFIKPATPGEPFINPKTGRDAVFISAKVDDNPHILKNDPGYVTYLDNLRGDLKKAWRDGSWDLIEVKGAYYGQEMRDAWKQHRIGKVPVDPAVPVHTAWDLGIDDSTSIIFFQLIGKEVRDVDYYENNEKGAGHYAKVLQNKGYYYGMHFAPHDIEVREYGTEEIPITRRARFAKLGIQFLTMPRVAQKIDGINMVRDLLPFSWIDSEKCELEISCLENYRRNYDEAKQCYEDHPLHDWTSHGHDAKQTQAQGVAYLKSQSQRGSGKRNRPARCGYGG